MSVREIGFFSLESGSVPSGRDGLYLRAYDYTESIPIITSPVTRDTTKDISLGTGRWNGAVSDGTTVWFTDNGRAFRDAWARAYTIATRMRDTTKDINLGRVNVYGGVSDGTTLWFVEEATPNTAYAYNASTRQADTTKNITLGRTGDFLGAVDHTNLFWFVNSLGNVVANAYNPATSSFVPSENIDLSFVAGDVYGGVSNGVTLWFIDAISTRSYAYAINATTRQRDGARFIHFPTSHRRYTGFSDGETIWFVNDTSNTAEAYTAPLPSVPFVPAKVINIGNTEYNRVFIGNTEYNKIYRGNELIWEK